MIHEGKLNDDLSRLSFSHFRSPRPGTSPLPHFRRPSESIAHRLPPPDSQFISRYCELSLSLFSLDLSVYPSIFIYLSTRLSSILLVLLLLFLDKPFYYDFIIRHFRRRHCVLEIYKNFLTYLANGKRNSCKSDKR